MEIGSVQKLGNDICENIEKVIIDKRREIELAVAVLLANGHILLEDVPGTGKTMLAKSLAKSVEAEFKRVQFTPDLLPSDLTGINYYNPKECEFVLKKGAMFTNILLADEINRATPRTQSSLLECMEEHQITIDGVTYPLEEPFFVIATQNPVETQGTYPLPEAQLDRFAIKLGLGYPSEGESVKMLDRFITGQPIDTISAVCTKENIISARKSVQRVYVHRELLEYAVRVADATRNNEMITLGLSSRGIISLIKICQSYGALQGRDYITPEDIKYIAKYAIAHRLIIKGGYKNKAENIISDILDSVSVPTENWSTRR